MYNILLLTTQTNDISVWNMVLKGGWLMIPIFLLSLISVYIFIERFLLLRKYAKGAEAYDQEFAEAMASSNINSALQIVSDNTLPTNRILQKGIKYRSLPTGELRALLENAATVEVSNLEKGLSTLATCAGMAPMIGFLGTVVGMIQAFYDMAQAGSNINITLLSSGIYTAMVTTVAGLIVGIIAQFAYNTLIGKIDKIVSTMEYNNSLFIETLYQNNNH